MTMSGTVTMVRAGGGTIRDAAGISFTFSRSDGGDYSDLRPGQQVRFDPVGPRFGRWFARNVTHSTSTTTSKGATR